MVMEPHVKELKSLEKNWTYLVGKIESQITIQQ